MELGGIEDAAYDLAYTSNGAHVWISALSRMYGSIFRKLKPGGQYIFFETHPFCRPFDQSTTELRIKKPYAETGPFGDPPTYGWRIEDFLRPLIGAGFALRDFREFTPRKDDLIDHGWHYKTYAAREQDQCRQYDWKINPWAALPTWMGARAMKGE